MVSLSFRTIMWLIPDALFLIFVMVANIGIVLAFIVSTVDVSEAEANIAIHRLHFSPNGISEYDATTGRVYTGKISSANFNDERIESALSYENIVMASRLKADTSTKLSPVPAANAYLNRDKYEKEWVIFALVEGEIGGKGIVPYPEARQVVFDNKVAKLETIVLMPR